MLALAVGEAVADLVAVGEAVAFGVLLEVGVLLGVGEGAEVAAASGIGFFIDVG